MAQRRALAPAMFGCPPTRASAMAAAGTDEQYSNRGKLSGSDGLGFELERRRPLDRERSRAASAQCALGVAELARAVCCGALLSITTTSKVSVPQAASGSQHARPTSASHS
jgi:hypothetical protein